MFLLPFRKVGTRGAHRGPSLQFCRDFLEFLAGRKFRFNKDPEAALKKLVTKRENERKRSKSIVASFSQMLKKSPDENSSSDDDGNLRKVFYYF